MAHVPFEQTAVAFAGAQTAPQLPQLSVSRFLFVSQPSVGSPLQSPRGATHVSILHTPPSHLAAAPANTQTLPQPLQFAASPRVSTSQPVSGRWSQSA